MKIHKNSIGIKTPLYEECISHMAKEFYTPEHNDYIVFDGNATILFEGTMPECYAYINIEYQGKDYGLPAIYTKEKYEEMIQLLDKSYYGKEK